MAVLKLTETGFPGLVIIDPSIFADDRGYFFESFNQRSTDIAGIDFKPMQDNESCSVYGVIRGLHFQNQPHAQAKIIRVVEGEIYDVALDIRKGSPTYGKWFGVKLSSENKRQFFVPKGFAHGFSVLSKKAIVLYKCDAYYSQKDEGGINALDPRLGIDWGIRKGEEVLSLKDKSNPMFKDAEHNFNFQ